MNWKNVGILTIFYALFVLVPSVRAGSDASVTDKVEIAKRELRSEKEILNKHLADVLLNANKKEKAHEKILISLAGIISDGKDKSEEINLDLLKALKYNIEAGDKVVSIIFEFCNSINNDISTLGISNEQKVKLKIKVDELRSYTEEFGLLVNRPEKKEVQHRNYRILDVSDQLQVVVISAGSLDGIRAGLTWNVKQAEDAVLKVIAVRAFVCAAVVIEGELSKISPGMQVEFSRN